MLCKDCPFIFTCWRGEQGEDLRRRNSVTACPDCGRWIVHIMAPLRASAQGNNFQTRVNMHYLFYCEKRSTKENLAYWHNEYFNKGTERKNGRRGAFDERSGHLNVRGRVGLVPCYACEGKMLNSSDYRDRMLDLDVDSFEEPPHWKEAK